MAASATKTQSSRNRPAGVEEGPALLKSKVYSKKRERSSNWIKVKPKCPLCKKNISKKTLTLAQVGLKKNLAAAPKLVAANQVDIFLIKL